MTFKRYSIWAVSLLTAACAVGGIAAAAPPVARVRQIITGPANHFFGYIGHARTIPWNASGRYVLALSTMFQDRMPTARNAAAVVLLDGDVTISLDGRWLANGSSIKGQNLFTFYRLSDGLVVRSAPLSRGRWTSGKLRIDGAPGWNREGTAVLTCAVADDKGGTRQLFLIELSSTGPVE